jgi:hypothetical protein
MLKNDIINALILEKTMGTYGVTHIKKAEKIIPLSDSHDGYFSGGMGQANLYTIKHMNNELLARLFDNFTAHLVQENQNETDDDEPTLTQREIEEAIFNFSGEPGVSEKAKQWFNSCLTEDLRTSITGAGPLLYLNFYSHYNRDYDYCDYLIDLDAQIYYLHGYPLDFATIRELSHDKINLLGGYVDDEQEKLFGITSRFSTLLDEYFSLTHQQDNESVQTHLKELSTQITAFISQINSLDEGKVKAYFDKKEQDRLAYVESLKNKNIPEENEFGTFPFPGGDELLQAGEDDMHAYSVRTARDLTPIQMRKILVFCNKLADMAPEAQILLKNAMWGMEEDFQSGGISFYSPRSSDILQQDCYEASMDVLEYEFKIRFNIMSTAGGSYKYAHEVTGLDKKDEEEAFGGFFGTPVIEQCRYPLSEIRAENPDLIDFMHPWLAYHGNWDEVRAEIVSGNNEMDSPLVWLYMALLYQDHEVFQAVYQKAMTQFNGVDATQQKKVSATILASVTDGIHVQNLVNSLAMTASLKIVTPADEFITYLKEQHFFNPLESYMNNSEKAKYLGQDTGKKKKP